MPLLADPAEDIMPLNEMDRAWVRQEIQATPKRHGLEKLTGFIKDWGGLGGAVAILVFAATQWNSYIEFRAATNQRLGSIEKSLDKLNGTLSSLQLTTHSSLTTGAFQSTLPELKSALVTAKKEKAPVAPKVINELQQKLLQSDPKAPDFWPAVGAFISYRSVLTHEDIANLQKSMPICTDHAPQNATLAQDVSPGTQTVKINPALYENCQLQLDSPEQNAKISYFAQTFPALTFRHCLVNYNGGLVQLRLGMWPLTFENCLWNISLPGLPPPNGQKVTETLLAGDPDLFRFPAL